jgi:tight adherence protein C
MPPSTAALVGAWTALILAGAWWARPAPARVRALTPAGVGPVRSRPHRLWRPSILRDRARRVGTAVAVGVVTAVVFPPAGIAAGVAVWMAPVARARRDRARASVALLSSLPDVVDLFVLAAGAGLTVPLSVAAVARRATGPVADDLGRVLDEVAGGRRLADALETVPARLGEAARPLIAALVASERYGAPLLDRLNRLAVEARADRRRRAEAAARRVPVKLLFPLVCCTLPAFGLLTVAPLLAGAVTTLRP